MKGGWGGGQEELEGRGGANLASSIVGSEQMVPKPRSSHTSMLFGDMEVNAKIN